jgi:hypothetical protein
MGNHVSNARQGQDGYWYWATCTEKDCTPAQAHYRIYNKNAGTIPVVSDAEEKYILFDVITMQEMLSKDSDRANFLKEWHFLETGGDGNMPEKPCIRVSPCNGIVKEKGLCCKEPIVTVANEETTENKEMSKTVWISIAIISSILIILIIASAFYFSRPLSQQT